MVQSNIVIDLSHHNQDLDFRRIKAEGGIRGIIEKATQDKPAVDFRHGLRRPSHPKQLHIGVAFHLAQMCVTKTSERMEPMARTLHHCPCFHQSQESLSLKNTGHVWLTRKGQVVIGNPEPDPHYLEYEMGMAWRELRYNGMPYEQDIWLE